MTEPTAIASSTSPSARGVELERVADLRDPRRPAREREAAEDEDGVDGQRGAAQAHLGGPVDAVRRGASTDDTYRARSAPAVERRAPDGGPIGVSAEVPLYAAARRRSRPALLAS